jgi:hypothetical protein
MPKTSLMKKVKLIILAMAVVGLSGCSKQIIQTKNIDGTYTGVVEVLNTDSAANAKPVQGRIVVNFKGMDYTCSANLVYEYASGAGKFFVRPDVMTFTDILIHPVGFNWNLVLNGSYKYSIAGDSITLVRKVEAKTFTYHLKKQ